MNDLVFEPVTRKVLLSKQKESKKKGKGNRPNASIFITCYDMNMLLYITSFKISSLPFAEILKENVEVFTLSRE